MRRLALVTAVLATACGGPLFFAELEIQSVRAVLPSQSFPASADWVTYPCPGTDYGPNCIDNKFTYDLGSQVPILNDDKVTSHVRLTELSIALQATGPLLDFGQVRSVMIRVLAPQGSTTLSDVVVASYQRSTANPNPSEISVAGYSNVDLVPYLQAGQLSVSVEMMYDTATPGFTADVTGDFYLEAKLDYGAYAGL